jgi:hypothetical protein
MKATPVLDRAIALAKVTKAALHIVTFGYILDRMSMT